jgi:hypothetical protein
MIILESKMQQNVSSRQHVTILCGKQPGQPLLMQVPSPPPQPESSVKKRIRQCVKRGNLQLSARAALLQLLLMPCTMII